MGRVGIMSQRGKAGFTLMEVLVVMALTAMILSLVFQILTDSRNSAIRLNKRTFTADDKVYSGNVLRDVIAGFIVPPLDVSSLSDNITGETLDDTTDIFNGASDSVDQGERGCSDGGLTQYHSVSPRTRCISVSMPGRSSKSWRWPRLAASWATTLRGGATSRAYSVSDRVAVSGMRWLREAGGVNADGWRRVADRRASPCG